MKVDDTKRVELINDVVELRLGITARNAIGGRDRRDSDAGARSADFLDNRSRDFQHQAGTVFDRAAIDVRSNKLP